MSAANQNLVDAMTLAEQTADKAVRAHQDWPAIERMAGDLASRARQLSASDGQAPPVRD